MNNFIKSILGFSLKNRFFHIFHGRRTATIAGDVQLPQHTHRSFSRRH